MIKKNGGFSGLDSLFSDSYIESAVAERSATTGPQILRLSEIEPKKDQPRLIFEEDAIEELANSIAQHGLLQPIIVRESTGGFYQIIAGERRWRASKLAGLTEVPVIIIEADALKAAEIAIIENVQRENLNPYEEAMAYGALVENYGLTQEQMAEKIGKSRSAIANALRLLELPEEVLEMLKTRDISAGHARALLGLKNKDIIVDTAQEIMIKSYSVREVESLVKKLNRLFERENAPKDEKPVTIDSMVNYAKDLEERAMSILGRRVKILDADKTKFIQIEYADNEELEELLVKLCGDKIKND